MFNKHTGWKTHICMVATINAEPWSFSFSVFLHVDVGDKRGSWKIASICTQDPANVQKISVAESCKTCHTLNALRSKLRQFDLSKVKYYIEVQSW